MNKSFPIYYETFVNPQNPCIILIAGIGGQLFDWSPKLAEFITGSHLEVIKKMVHDCQIILLTK